MCRLSTRSDNKFAGKIPQWKCPALRNLQLGANKLTGFAENCEDPDFLRREEKRQRDLADPNSKASRDVS